MTYGDDTTQWAVTVVASYPHDPTAYTQGLTIYEGELYEGTGQYGRSSVRRVDLATGIVERRRALRPEFFGEGITRQRLPGTLGDDSLKQSQLILVGEIGVVVAVTGQAQDLRNGCRVDGRLLANIQA